MLSFKDLVLWDGLDEALVGYAMSTDLLPIAVYSYAKALDVLEGQGMEYLEAAEYLEFNVISAYVGERTPIWVFEATADGIRELEESMTV